jgi:UDP-2,4-diacetamido-2,4,6-trideoxy-beta-L-altropyranose hydrolase
MNKTLGRIRLRPACAEDMECIFEWRNDPWIVSLSISKKTVTRLEHEYWFARILNREKHLLYILANKNGTEMGTLRFDRKGPSQALVTIYLLRPFTGKGYGVAGLIKGSAEAFSSWPDLQSIDALIRAENRPSIRAFCKAGYQIVKKAPGEILMRLHRDSKGR